ncbi:MAG: isochorismatase family protein [Dehalococcoidia bacterium]
MAVAYDPRTALVIIDLQNDFASPQGSLFVAGAERVVEQVNRQIALARAAGGHVLYTLDWHPPQTPHFQPQGGIWPVHCVAESWGAQFHPALTVGGEIVRKGAGTEDGYSGFTVRDHESGERSATLLEGLLRERGVERVIVVGLATDYCVKATALDAAGKGFETVVLLDAVAGVELAPGDTERAQDELRAAGVALL